MAISVCWDNEEQTALRVVYAERWNWRDHRLALDTVNTLLNTVNHKIDLVLDLQESEPLPQSMLVETIASEQVIHPNWTGTVMIITANRELARAVLDVTPGLRAGCRNGSQAESAPIAAAAR